MAATSTAVTATKSQGPMLGGAANKKPEPAIIQFQIEAETEVQWRTLLRREGLIVIDVYASWAGPCTSMINILKRVKVEVNDDRLWYGMANSDHIDDLLMFKDQSQPTWLFVAGSKPIRVFRGSHAPKLIEAIKSELEHEVQCIEGKSRRNFISIDDEVSRRKKAEAEAVRLADLVVEQDDAAAETLNEIRRDSSISLMGNLEPYTVAIIQPFVIEAGNAQEIKDFLMGEFKVAQEIIVTVTEDLARNLYKIPYEKSLVPKFGYVPPPEESITEDEGDEDEVKPKKTKAPPKPNITTEPIPLPDGVLGETIAMLLMSQEIKRLADGGKKPQGTLLQTADDYIRLKVGPVKYADAMEHAPACLHAAYGKEEAPGIWCPRTYDDKRFAMLNFFPTFVQKVIAMKPSEPPKYMVVVFPLNVVVALSENKEVSENTRDIVAKEKMRIPEKIVDEMLASWNLQGPDAMTKSAALISDLIVMSINERNVALKDALKALNPIHVSFNDVFGRKETSKLFPKLKISEVEKNDPDEILERFLARSRPRIKSVMALKEMDDSLMLPPPDDEDDEEEATEAAPEGEASKGSEGHNEPSERKSKDMANEEEEVDDD